MSKPSLVSFTNWARDERPDNIVMNHRKKVAVIGAGITGLAAAWRLAGQSEPVDVTVFEKSHRAGGIIQTIRRDGFLIELGPDSFITNKPGAVDLCREIGFLDQLIPTDSTWRRSLVLRKSKPLPVPDGFMLMAPARPSAILSTPILSLFGKLRLLSEVLVPRRTDHEDESLASFVRRRFGCEALDRLVQPLIGGIYTSDPEKLSLQATLPRFPEMEETYGSVIRGTLANQRLARSNTNSQGSGARYDLFLTARDGLSSLVEAIVAACQKTGRIEFRFQQDVQRIAAGNAPVTPAELPHEETNRVEASAISRRWTVSVRDQPDESFDAVIMTLPTHQASSVLSGDHFAPLQSALNAIEYASSAIVVSGHKLSDLQHPLDAFGLVIPHKEHREILAVSFSSRKFSGRAPDDCVLLRTFVGGAMQPHLMQRSDTELTALVRHELHELLGLQADPVFEQVARYPRGMPQYHVGHLHRVQQIEDQVLQFPGLQIAGSAFYGVGLPDSIASANSAADRVISDWRS